MIGSVAGEEIYEYRGRSAAAPVPTDPGRTQSTVAKILSRASSLKAPEEIEELTAGLLALRAKRIAPVVSHDETRLLLAINEGVPVELTDRAESLIEKRDDCSLTVEENSESCNSPTKSSAGVWSGLRRCRNWPNSVVSRFAN